MKKIISTALIAVVLSTMIVDTISAARSNQPRMAKGKGVRKNRGGSRIRDIRRNAKNVQVVLQTVKQTDNPVVKQQALTSANQLAKELLMDLQDRTWAGDVLGKYTEEQVANAGKKYTDLAVQKDQLERDIASKQAELDSMSVPGRIWGSSVEGGKEEAHKIASTELADMKATLRDVNKAMRNQAVIAGKEYCTAIRMALGAITAVGLAGGAYGIDKYVAGNKLGIASRMETGYEAAGKEWGELRTKGVKAYTSERGSAVYTSISDAFNAIYTGAGKKANALKAAIDDQLARIWGSKEEAPKIVVNATNAAVTAQEKADKSGKDADQVNADGKIAAADVVVGEESAKNE